MCPVLDVAGGYWWMLGFAGLALGQRAEESQSGQREEAKGGRSWWWPLAISVCARGGGSPTRWWPVRTGGGRCGRALGVHKGQQGRGQGVERFGQVEEVSMVRREGGKGRGNGDFRMTGRGCWPQMGTTMTHTFPETRSSLGGRDQSTPRFGRTWSRFCASPASSWPSVLCQAMPGRQGLAVPSGAGLSAAWWARGRAQAQEGRRGRQGDGDGGVSPWPEGALLGDLSPS